MRIGFVIAVLAVLTSVGCGSKPESGIATGPDSGVVFKMEEKGLKAELNTGQGLTLPDSFPSDVAKPEDAKVVSVINFDKAGVYTFEVKQEADANSIKQTYESLQSKMLMDGWKSVVTSISETGASMVLKKDSRTATYSISKQKGSVAVMINITN